MRSILLILTLVLVSLAIHDCHAKKNKADKQAYTNLINKLMKDTKNKWKSKNQNSIPI